MILFAILLIMAAILSVIAFTTITVGGTAFIVIFGDLIVCVAIIVFIMKWIFKKKKK